MESPFIVKVAEVVCVLKLNCKQEREILIKQILQSGDVCLEEVKQAIENHRKTLKC